MNRLNGSDMQVATKEILRFEALWLKHFKDTRGDVLKERWLLHAVAARIEFRMKTLLLFDTPFQGSQPNRYGITERMP